MRALVLSLLTFASFSIQAETFVCVGGGQFAPMGAQTLNLVVDGEAYRAVVNENSVVIGLTNENSQTSLVIMVAKASPQHMVYGAAGSADKTVTYNEFSLKEILSESNSITCKPAK